MSGQQVNMFLLPDQVYGEESHRLTVSSRPTMPPQPQPPQPQPPGCGGVQIKLPDSSSGCEEPDTDGYGQEMSRLLSNLDCWHSRHGYTSNSHFSLAKISQKFEMKKQFSVKDEIWVDLPPTKDNKVVKTICRQKESGRTILKIGRDHDEHFKTKKVLNYVHYVQSTYTLKSKISSYVEVLSMTSYLFMIEHVYSSTTTAYWLLF